MIQRLESDTLLLPFLSFRFLSHCSKFLYCNTRNTMLSPCLRIPGKSTLLPSLPFTYLRVHLLPLSLPYPLSLNSTFHSLIRSSKWPLLLIYLFSLQDSKHSVLGLEWRMSYSTLSVQFSYVWQRVRSTD